MFNTLGEKCPSNVPMKNSIVSIKSTKFAITDEDRSGKLVYDMTSIDCRFELKQISETLNFLCRRAYHVVHVDRAKVEASSSICAQFEKDADFVSRT